MTDVKLPRIYLIKRSAVQSGPVQAALDINPVAGVLSASPADAEAAIEANLSNEVMGMSGAPLAVVAEFDAPLTVIYEDGSVEILCPAPEQSSKS